MQEEISLADETFLTDVVLKLAQERSFQVIYGLLLPVNRPPARFGRDTEESTCPYAGEEFLRSCKESPSKSS